MNREVYQFPEFDFAERERIIYEHSIIISRIASEAAKEINDIEKYDPIEISALINFLITSRTSGNEVNEFHDILGNKNVDYKNLRVKYLVFIQKTIPNVFDVIEGRDAVICSRAKNCLITTFFKEALRNGKIDPHSPNWPMVVAWFTMDISDNIGFTAEDSRENNDFLEGYVRYKLGLVRNAIDNLNTNQLDPKDPRQTFYYFKSIEKMVLYVGTNAKQEIRFIDISTSFSRLGLGNTTTTLSILKTAAEPNSKLGDINGNDKNIDEKDDISPEKS